jgi:hypothetical protein
MLQFLKTQISRNYLDLREAIEDTVQLGSTAHLTQNCDGEHFRKRPLGRQQRSYEDNIKVELRGTSKHWGRGEYVVRKELWMEMAQDRVQWLSYFAVPSILVLLPLSKLQS